MDQQVRWFVKQEILEVASQVGIALLFEEGVIVDMKVVCPQGVENMLKHRAKEVAGKRCATKHG